jgi:phosphatidate cytidylyltransferase
VSDLKVRILSAAVAIVIAVIVFILHNTILLPITVAFVIGMMIFELLRAASCVKFYSASIPAIAYGVLIPLIYATKLYEYKLVFQIALIFALFITFISKHEVLKYEQVTFIAAVSFIVPEAMLTALKTEALDDKHGIVLLILGLCGAWIADSGAYFAGTFFGKHKLCPTISPKKTVEGLVGGIIITGIVFVAFNFVYANYISDENIKVNYIITAVTGMICAVIGTIGDLSASLIKRQCGIKDYGKIMPGHGGIMDRFDSVLFVMPTFYAFVSAGDFYK